LSKIGEDNPVLLVHVAGNSNPSQVASIAQVDALLESIDTSTYWAFVTERCFELIYSCGLRISEACDLRFPTIKDQYRVVESVIRSYHSRR
jgi:integrase/recombinase XerD